MVFSNIEMPEFFRKISIFFLLLFLIGGISEINIAAQTTKKFSSGIYESLMIGINASGELTGYFVEGTGDDGKGNPQFNCIFYISGEKEFEGKYRIKTWFPGDSSDVIGGQIKYSAANGRQFVNLHLDGEHGGCWNVAPALKDPEGVDYEMTSPGNWQAIRVIAPAKAYFYKFAEVKSKLKSYAVKGDGVEIIQTKGAWAEVILTNGKGKTTKGWMPTENFFAVKP